MRRLKSERGFGFVAVVVTVFALTVNNYLIHGDISVACQYMALPQAACQ